MKLDALNIAEKNDQVMMNLLGLTVYTPAQVSFGQGIGLMNFSGWPWVSPVSQHFKLSFVDILS
jgi:hypothetical protein